jgi:prolyl-tRNA synthetase
MSKGKKSAINPVRTENFPEWYQQVVKEAKLAENSMTRGSMIIMPYGQAIWENIQSYLDKEFKRTGHKNVYFPLLIPLSLLEKEAEHVEGFAKECAVVTHRRLVQTDEGGLEPDGKLNEPYVIRPTSEMVIGEAFSRWVNSHRDLPVLINQWANVMRWEMRPRVFLRTAEFLWQEGHTVHATKEEAQEETFQMLDIYQRFMEEVLAMPVIKGQKSESEKFPGADDTYTVEAMMQDGKALQAGTSHFLGQNFAKAQNIKFLNNNNEEVHAWTTSWGVSTRMIGGMIMSHGDDDGLITPPRIAPYHISIIPMAKNDDQKATVFPFCEKIKEQLEAQTFFGAPVRVELDLSDHKSVDKKWRAIKQGSPLIAEIGARDIEKNSVFLATRTDMSKEGVPVEELISSIVSRLEKTQETLFNNALTRMKENTHTVNSLDEFKELFSADDESNTIHPFAYAFVDDNEETLKMLKEYKTSIRCYPMDDKLDTSETGTCIFSGKEGCKRAVIARSY